MNTILGDTKHLVENGCNYNFKEIIMEVKIWNENTNGAGMVASTEATESDTRTFTSEDVPYLKSELRKVARKPLGACSKFWYHSVKNALEYLEGEIRNIRT